MSSPLPSSCLSVFPCSSLFSTSRSAPHHLTLQYASWPGTSSASAHTESFRSIWFTLLVEMEREGREVGGWAGRRWKKRRKAASPVPPQRGAYKRTNFSAHRALCLFKHPILLSLVWAKFLGKKKKCVPHPKQWGLHPNFLFFPNLSSLQWFSSRGNSALWRPMEIRVASLALSLLGNSVD